MSASFEKFVNDYVDVLNKYKTNDFDNACNRFVSSWCGSFDFETLELVNFFNAADEFILECVPGLSPAEQREFLFVFLKVREKIMPQLPAYSLAHAHVVTKRSAKTNQENSALKNKEKTDKRIKRLLKRYNIVINANTTASQIVNTLTEKGVKKIPDVKTFRRYLKQK